MSLYQWPFPGSNARGQHTQGHRAVTTRAAVFRIITVAVGQGQKTGGQGQRTPGQDQRTLRRRTSQGHAEVPRYEGVGDHPVTWTDDVLRGTAYMCLYAYIKCLDGLNSMLIYDPISSSIRRIRGFNPFSFTGTCRLFLCLSVVYASRRLRTFYWLEFSFHLWFLIIKFYMFFFQPQCFQLICLYSMLIYDQISRSIRWYGTQIR